MSYKSARTKVDVALEPLTLSWSAQPTYVGNRGSLIVGGMANGASIQSVTSSNNDIAKSAGYSGNNVYVNLVGGGNATITVNANNGQSGTIQASATLPYLVEANGASVFYANPDGSHIRTGNDGLSGNRPTFGYYRTNVVSDANKFIVGTDNSSTTTYVGLNIAPDIYDSYMEPTMSIDGNKFSYALPVYDSDSKLTVIWCGVKALHLSNWDYPLVNNASLGTCSVSSKASSTGINSVVLNLRSVNPFALWTGDVVKMPDEEDFGLVNAYHQLSNHTYDEHKVSFPKIIAGDIYQGIDVWRNGVALPSGTLKSRFVSQINYLEGGVQETSYTLTEAALSEHIGGLIELKGYVRNSYSNEYVYKDGATIGVYVYGAIGGKLTGVGTNTVTVSTAWAGDEGNSPFSNVSANIVTTEYKEGDPFVKIPGVTVINVVPGGVQLNEPLYALHVDSGILAYDAPIKSAEPPRFKIKEISSVGVYVEDDSHGFGFYYLQPGGSPSVYDESIEREHGYYKLVLLESIVLNFKSAWVD